MNNFIDYKLQCARVLGLFLIIKYNHIIVNLHRNVKGLEYFRNVVSVVSFFFFVSALGRATRFLQVAKLVGSLRVLNDNRTAL